MQSVTGSDCNYRPAAGENIVPEQRVFFIGPRFLAIILASAFLAGCSAYTEYLPTSEGHLGLEKPRPKPVPAKEIPPPARVSTFVPAPKPKVKPQTYTVVVNEVPAKELLLALARDTKQNIDIHPGIVGLVSLNAVNETLPSILDRISKQVNMRYETEGHAIIVSPDTPYVKTYRVPYVDMQRSSTSIVGVSGQVSAGGQGGGAAGASTQGSGSASSTIVTTKMTMDFYRTLRENITGILRTVRAQKMSAEERQRRREDQRLAAQLTMQSLQAQQSGRAATGQGATGQMGNLLSNAAAIGSATVSRVEDDVIVNALSGTVTVSATEYEHKLIQQHIDSILRSAERQVLIEATIVEVQLNNNYQGGIDWSRLSQSGGFAFTQALLGGNLGTAPFFGAFYNNNNPQNQINVTVKLLEQFGNTRVLSSPKMMALNNQTALLKVVDNVVYFEVQAQTNQQQTSSLTTVTTTPKTVAVGVVMGVTPQIGDDNRIALTVRPTITRLNPQAPFVNDPNPTLCNADKTSCIPNQVPQVQTREMESVLQVGNGQMVVLGGLMQDESQRNRDQVPGIGNVPNVGELFAYRQDQVTKSELVIFLRATVVNNPTLESDALKFFQRYLPTPAPRPDLRDVPKDLRPPNLREQQPTTPANKAQ